MIVPKEFFEVFVCKDDGTFEFLVIGDIHQYNFHAIALIFLNITKVPEGYTSLKKEGVKELLIRNRKSLKLAQEGLSEKINKSLEMILRDLYNQKGKNQILTL
ncbi:MAG: hypothetical protein N4A44_00040 [Alphaproteobacteria bacterium]|jgi:hypothetical protein|nr:hypothetical protein [Alphaproteobacteria bacterium]